MFGAGIALTTAPLLICFLNIPNLTSSELNISVTSEIIKGFVKENNECLDVVGVLFEGEVFDPSKYVELANLPSREELIAKFASCLNQPMTTLAATLNGAMTKLAGTLDSLKNTKA